MSYYTKEQTVKYKEDQGPVVVVLEAEEAWDLLESRRLGDGPAKKLEEQTYGFFAPKLVLKERKRDIDLCQRTYDAIEAALEGGLEGRDIALLLASAEYDLYGPSGAHGGMTDRELPDGAVDHDQYWKSL
jgi:hypothetical protein